MSIDCSLLNLIQCSKLDVQCSMFIDLVLNPLREGFIKTPAMQVVGDYSRNSSFLDRH